MCAGVWPRSHLGSFSFNSHSLHSFPPTLSHSHCSVSHFLMSHTLTHLTTTGVSHSAGQEPSLCEMHALRVVLHPSHTFMNCPTTLTLLQQVYRTLLRHSPVVQHMSVDEAYLDLTGLGFSDPGAPEPQQLVARIRQEIFETTGCTASAGTAGVLLFVWLWSFLDFGAHAVHSTGCRLQHNSC